MKSIIENWKRVAEVFGLKSQEEVNRRVALGSIPGLENIDTGLNVSIKEAEKYLLPLRIETGRNPDNRNERVYDYSEVTAAIDKHVSGEITQEGLPSYSAESPLIIHQAQQDKRLKEIAAQEVAVLKN